MESHKDLKKKYKYLSQVVEQQNAKKNTFKHKDKEYNNIQKERKTISIHKDKEFKGIQKDKEYKGNQK